MEDVLVEGQRLCFSIGLVGLEEVPAEVVVVDGQVENEADPTH